MGTPATRAEIIEKLISSFYMERKGKQLVPTSKARQLIELAPESLTSPVLTAQWEEQLNLIARGNSSRKQFMESIKSSARQMIKDIKEDQSEYKPDNVSRKKCPACGKNMLLVQGKKGKMLVCQDRSCGHRQPEKAQEGDIFKKNRQQDRVNQRLLKKYSDDGEFGSNLGEILKAALEEKSRKTQNEKQQ